MLGIVLFLLLPIASVSGWLIGRRALSLQTIREFLTLTKPKTQKVTDVLAELIQSNEEVVDTHLALGGAFRRSGEVDKAVGIHQNLIRKSSLTQEQRVVSLIELAHDYMRAGMLDHAEKVLLELTENTEKNEKVYSLLLDIYQQSQDWKRAIELAQEWQDKTKKNKNHHIANFYCELAEQQWLKGEREDAQEQLMFALKANPQCVRASLLLGNIEFQMGHYEKAIRAYQKVEKQDVAFLSEIILPLARCYENLNDSEGIVRYFEKCLKQQATTPVVLAFTEWLYKNKGQERAIEFISQHLKKYPSLLGLNQLIQLSMKNSQDSTRQDLQLFQGVVEKMVLKKPLYQCETCGFSSRILQWQCPGCKGWDRIKPIHE